LHLREFACTGGVGLARGHAWIPRKSRDACWILLPPRSFRCLPLHGHGRMGVGSVVDAINHASSLALHTLSPRARALYAALPCAACLAVAVVRVAGHTACASCMQQCNIVSAYEAVEALHALMLSCLMDDSTTHHLSVVGRAPSLTLVCMYCKYKRCRLIRAQPGSVRDSLLECFLQTPVVYCW
jgi:hypothetical protein